jgi:hypothetical protein
MERNGNQRKLFACYLLVSLNPMKRGRTYIGFTVRDGYPLECGSSRCALTGGLLLHMRRDAVDEQ